MLLARIMSKEEYRIFQENGIVEPPKEVFLERSWDNRNKGKEGDYTFMALNNLKNIVCNYSVLAWFNLNWYVKLERGLKEEIKEKYEDDGMELSFKEIENELYKELVEQGYEIYSDELINYKTDNVIQKYDYLWETYGKEKDDNFLVFFESSSITEDMIYEGNYAGFIRIDEYDNPGKYGVDKSAEIAVPNYSKDDFKVVYATPVKGNTLSKKYDEFILRLKLIEQYLHKNENKSVLYEDFLKWIGEQYFSYIEENDKENKIENKDKLKEEFLKFLYTQNNPFEGEKDEDEIGIQFPLYEEMLIELSLKGELFQEKEKNIKDIISDYLHARLYEKAHNKYFYDDLEIQNMDEEIEKFLYILKSRKIVDEHQFLGIAAEYYQTLNNWEYDDIGYEDDYEYDYEYGDEYDNEEYEEPIEITEQDIKKTISDSIIDREKGKEILNELVKENQVEKE